ncbi:MAG: M3 family oligoendopeptidase [Candidatus Methylomirabilales bacterium]
MGSADLSATGVVWDLRDLFASPDDQCIEETMRSVQERAAVFARRYRGTICVPGGPAASHLLEALQELEGIEDTANRVGSYAGLLYASDSLRPEYQDLHQRVEQWSTVIQNCLLFFDLEWLELDDAAVARLLADPLLSGYRHYLQHSRHYRPHKLSEPEERVVNEKDNTGRRAFGRLFSELISSLSFPIERDGALHELTMSELLALLHRPDRSLRARAMESLFEVLVHHQLVLSVTYDTLVQDHLTMDRLRRYPGPMAERHLSNEIDRQAVEQMMETTEKNYAIAQEYFRFKAKLLGLDRLALYDQYAPVGGELPRCTFAEAQTTILEAFEAFSPRFREIAQGFFVRRWIDAEIRKGKRGGAFCASPGPTSHPYILCNYTDTLRDVTTVAHELGHGLHGVLASKQTPLNYDCPLITCETASVFAEFLVFDYLLNTRQDPRVQLGLLCGKIEDVFATVFRQNVLTRFEEAVFAARPNGRLTPEILGEAWLAANGRYYGDAVEMIPAYRLGWSYIPHFIHTRFYCYSYVFGELLVLSLYRMYKETGASFVPKYLQLLEAGASDAPEVLLKPLGVDFRDPGFWQKAFDEVRALVARVGTLAATLGPIAADSRKG